MGRQRQVPAGNFKPLHNQFRWSRYCTGGKQLTVIVNSRVDKLQIPNADPPHITTYCLYPGLSITSPLHYNTKYPITIITTRGLSTPYRPAPSALSRQEKKKPPLPEESPVRHVSPQSPGWQGVGGPNLSLVLYQRARETTIRNATVLSIRPFNVVFLANLLAMEERQDNYIFPINPGRPKYSRGKRLGMRGIYTCSARTARE